MANVDSGTLGRSNKPVPGVSKSTRSPHAPASATTPLAPPVSPPVPLPASAVDPTPAPSAIVTPSELIDSTGGLSMAQRTAITLLTEGRSIKSVAERVGVHRVTLHRWLKEDHGFRAAYFSWKAEVQESAQAQLLSLSSAAIKTFRKAILGGGVRAAVMLLKGLSLLSPSLPPPARKIPSAPGVRARSIASIARPP